MPRHTDARGTEAAPAAAWRRCSLPLQLCQGATANRATICRPMRALGLRCDRPWAVSSIVSEKKQTANERTALTLRLISQVYVAGTSAPASTRFAPCSICSCRPRAAPPHDPQNRVPHREAGRIPRVLAIACVALMARIPTRLGLASSTAGGGAAPTFSRSHCGKPPSRIETWGQRFVC